MEPYLSQPGVLLGVAVAAGVLVALAGMASRRRPGAPQAAARVAHTERLRALASYRRAVRSRRLGLSVVAILLLAGIAVSGYVAARPMVLQTRQSHLDSRDIVLCLDVSGSMSQEDLAIIRTFRRLVSGLQGERIGLVLFNSMPLVIFPLTDDYDLIRTRLADAEASIDEGSYATGPDIAEGAMDPSVGTSLIGDGLMGCAQQFTADVALAKLRAAQPAAASAVAPPAATAKRSRIIIVATDNMDASNTGAALFTVDEAAVRARGLGAMIVAISANSSADSAEARELAAAASLTGGSTYPTGGGAQAVEKITAIVNSLDSTTIEGAPVTSSFDVPGRALGALLTIVVALVLAWRVVRP